jgi:protein tyrosine/serine phosphatase
MLTADAAGRRLSWPDCRNVRDLGGIPTADGCQIRPAALIRADNLGRLTAAGVAALRRSGVGRIVDLRSDWERARHPSPFADDPIYLAAQFISEQREAERGTTPVRPLAEAYRVSVERDAWSITAAVAAVADAPAGAVVVHCASGKDRTGITVALALSAVGADRGAVAADYAYTAECLRDEREATLAAAEPASRQMLRDRLSSWPDTMLDLLGHVDARFGGVVRYLLGHGLTAEQLARLRARLRDRAR